MLTNEITRPAIALNLVWVKSECTPYFIECRNSVHMEGVIVSKSGLNQNPQRELF